MDTQLEAILRRNEEILQKAMEKVLKQMQDKIKGDIASPKEQHKVEFEQNQA